MLEGTEKDWCCTQVSDLQIKNLSKTFADVGAVDDISLTIEKGEFLTLLGPSGSGKTTTLMMIAGFETPTAGDILIAGESIVRKPPFRRNIGIVFQHYSLFPHMTVFDNIAFPLRMRKVEGSEITRRVKRSLDLVQLPDYSSRYPRQLSGGQQQRVALARALVFDPPILLMDEPLGALDKNLREHMQLEIKQLQRQLKITTVYVTHDQQEALTMSDRIAVMNHGRIEQLGSPEEVYERPCNRFVADFIGESNFFEGRVIDRKEDGWVLQTVSALRIGIPRVDQLQLGDNLQLTVRPERIIFPGEGSMPSHFNLYEGIVEEATYVGEMIRFSICVAGGEVLCVKKQNMVGTPKFQKGDRARVGWFWEDATLLGIQCRDPS
jgi:putative spermidine/putrescine transport system ATP-binding protein